MRSVRASACASRDHAAAESGASFVACSQAETSAPVSPIRFATSARSSSPCSLGSIERACSSAARAPSRSKTRRRRRPSRSHAEPSLGASCGLPHGGVDRHRERAHVLVDARRVAVRRGALGLGARPVAHGAPGGREVARLPERDRQQPQHGRVARVGVAGVDEPLGGDLEVALGERVLGGGHEALDAVGAGVGLREVDELQRARGDGADADLEGDARPLLHVVAGAGEVDAVDAADAPLGIGEAARVAVHDRVVGHARGERVVLLAILPRARARAARPRRRAGPPRRAPCARPGRTP